MEDVSKRAGRIIRLCGKNFSGGIKKVKTYAAYGGGSMPGEEFESLGIEISLKDFSAFEFYDYFVSCNPPIIGTIRDDKFIIDMWTVFDRDIKDVATSIEGLNKLIK